ncbi:MAG TPA: hypothetical protein VJ752_08270 [Burkholderiaceae bacterium]|nr:hypothetical protein [Burkholderiaceae bacterium]
MSRAADAARPAAPPAHGPGPAPGSAWPWPLLALPLSLAVALGALAQFRLPLNHDVAWLLALAGRVLEGARLYVDYPEVNPPLIVWLNLPVAWAAQLTGLTPATAVRLAVVALAGLALGASALLARGPIAAGGGAAMLALAAYVLVALPGYDFGQREHLALLFALPYLVEAAGRAGGAPASPGARLAVAAWATVGIALKPHFVLVPLLVEAVVLAHGRRRPGAGLALMAALLAAYGMVVLWLTPDYLPMMRLFARAYWHYGSDSWFDFLRVAQCQSALILVACHWALRPAPRATGHVLSAAALGFAVAAVVQHKGWSYHWYPVLALGWLLFAQAGAHAVARRAWRGRPLAPALAGALAILLAGLALLTAPRDGQRANPYPALLGPPIHALGGGPVLVLASPLRVAYPLVTEAGLSATARFPSMGMVAAAWRTGDEAVGGYLRRTLAQDVLARPPRLIVVESDPDSLPPGFDYLRYFGREPALERLFQSSRQVGAVGPFRILRVAPAGAPGPVVSVPQHP